MRKEIGSIVEIKTDKDGMVKIKTEFETLPIHVVETICNNIKEEATKQTVLNLKDKNFRDKILNNADQFSELTDTIKSYKKFNTIYKIVIAILAAVLVYFISSGVK